jgi:hypothetical protein
MYLSTTTKWPWLVLLSLTMLVTACGGDDNKPSRVDVGGSCVGTADCVDGLVCLGQICSVLGPDCPDDKDCKGLICGLDPVCGQSCGTCGDAKVCEGGLCVDEVCSPACDDLECGPDPVCGQSCGTCKEGWFCDSGLCFNETCVPECGDLECGPDPACGLDCGTCINGEVCDDGLCSDGICHPDCGALECGPDLVCVQSCGTCEQGAVCHAGVCKPGYVPGTIRWIAIPGGTFQMGCSPNDGDCYLDELPVHQVTLDAFEMLETEVTEAQYEAEMGTNPSCHENGASGPDYPVECVNWFGAADFCKRIGGRLPTEAEWEYAARGGTTTRLYCGDEEACLDWIAWFGGGFDAQKKPVAGKDPNAYGLYDMLGNVWELTADRYGPYESTAQTNPQGPNDESYPSRVVRGGCVDLGGYSVRASYRGQTSPLFGVSVTGLRCARDMP